MMDKKRRTLERFKTALIVLLTLSALVLALRSPLLQSAGLPFLFDQGLANSTSLTPQTGSLPTAAVPARLVVGTSVSRYGIQYDQEAADNLFDQTAPLLGEALGSAESSSTLSEHEWQALLTGQCLYFGYLSPIPLSVLSGWLTGDKANSSLVDSTRHIVLAAGTDGMLTLSYQGVDGGFYQCATSLDASLHLEPVVSSVDPNGAFFAFEADLPSVVDPYTLFTEEEVSALVYDSANPLSLSDGDQLTSLLSALAFSDQNQAPVNDGYTYVDGEDTLRVLQGASVVYHSSGEGRYTAQPGLSGAVEAAWVLANAAAAPLAGQARLYLLSAQADADQKDHYTVIFGYCLNGSAVHLYDDGWAAVFEVTEGVVTDFTIRLRSYSAAPQQALLLPAEKAAAALTALTQDSRELSVQYRDNGDGQAVPYWNAT